MGGSALPERIVARRPALGALVIDLRPSSYTVDRQDCRGDIRQEARMPRQGELGNPKRDVSLPQEPVIFASDREENSFSGG